MPQRLAPHPLPAGRVTGMTVTLALSTIEVIMLAGVRIAAFLVIAPPFASRAVPAN